MIAISDWQWLIVVLINAVIVIAVIAIVCCQYCSYKRRQSNAGRRPDNSFPEVIEIQETEMDNNLKEKNKRKKKKKIKEPIVILVPA